MIEVYDKYYKGIAYYVAMGRNERWNINLNGPTNRRYEALNADMSLLVDIDPDEHEDAEKP